MRKGILCCLGAGIFLVTVTNAHATQGKQATGTPDGLTVALKLGTTAQEAAEHPELHHRNPRYQLVKDDELQLNFALTPEFNQTVTVQQDGSMTLLVVDDLHVERQA